MSGDPYLAAAIRQSIDRLLVNQETELKEKPLRRPIEVIDTIARLRSASALRRVLRRGQLPLWLGRPPGPRGAQTGKPNWFPFARRTPAFHRTPPRRRGTSRPR